jgi:hypothetical protein
MTKIWNIYRKQRLISSLPYCDVYQSKDKKTKKYVLIIEINIKKYNRMFKNNCKKEEIRNFKK